MSLRSPRTWNRFSWWLGCALLLGCGDGTVLFPDDTQRPGAVTAGGAGAGGGSALAGAAGELPTMNASGAGSGTGGAHVAGGGGAGPTGGVSSGGAGSPTLVGGAGGSTEAGGNAGASGASAGAFAPCPSSGSCKILPLGDSITDGLTVAGGYRIHLYELALKDGRDITFVGGSMNGPMTVAGKPFPRAHEGHSGWTITQLDGIVPKPALDVSPHIVLLHIGTNDMYQAAANADQRLGALIDQITDALPRALVVVSTIIPFPGSADEVTTYNLAVAQVVQARTQAGKHVVLVDQFQGFPTAELADGVHPNADGYARMAGVWYAAISGYLR